MNYSFTTCPICYNNLDSFISPPLIKSLWCQSKTHEVQINFILNEISGYHCTLINEDSTLDINYNGREIFFHERKFNPFSKISFSLNKEFDYNFLNKNEINNCIKQLRKFAILI